MRIISILILLNLCHFSLNGQNDTTTLRVFHNAYALIVSEDESILAVLNGDKQIEFFEIQSLKKIQTVKVSRNAWLNRAYFSDDHTEFYYDYGMQLKTKYKVVNIKSGMVKKINCTQTAKGCSYQSLKYSSDSPLVLTTRPITFIREDINIKMLKSN